MPGSLMFDNINSYIVGNLNENNQTEWLPAISAATKNCEKFLSGKIFFSPDKINYKYLIVEKMSSVAEKVESADASCFTKPYLYIQCIKQHALLVCF